MIELQVADYCHDCQGFDPVTTSLADTFGHRTTIVTCEKERLCRNIERYLRRKLEAEHGTEAERAD